MIKVNENFLKLQDSYLFSTIAKKVAEYQKENPSAKVIKLGIGDVTRPIASAIIEAMKNAVDEMSESSTFRGYGPEQGYEFLREKIAEFDYKNRGVDISPKEIFVSDGAKCDCGNIVDIFSIANKVAITDPVYPVYLDTNVMAGRTGNYNSETGKYEKIIYIPVTAENNFIPEFPSEAPDMIYLCFPNNPTGTTLSKEELTELFDKTELKPSDRRAIEAINSEATIEKLQTQIHEYEAEKAKAVSLDRSEELARKDEQIRDLSHTIYEKNQELSQAADRTQGLERKLAEMEKSIEAKQAELERAKARVEELEKEKTIEASQSEKTQGWGQTTTSSWGDKSQSGWGTKSTSIEEEKTW